MSAGRINCLSLAIVFSLLARGVGAQADASRGDGGTSVSGVVHDSIADTSLAGATVQLVARDNPASVFNAVSDSLGRYRLNGVPLGSYRIGFFHPILDSLGVEAPIRDVYVASYSPVIANVAVPSGATLRKAVCGAGKAGGSGAVIIGTVREAQDGIPAPKVAVIGEWYEYALRRTGMARQLARRNATSGDNGWFALCDVPTEGSVTLLATTGTDSTGTIEVQIPAGGFVRRELYLGAAEPEPPITRAATSASVPAPMRRIRVGHGHVSGTVTTNVGNRPLANALVTIVDGPQTRTDA
ncbi:MAG: carboxypeptidase-like regulatory domain-containing protein, partial [Gemmatimonadaceae bacterium]